jgi:hypothetical protein
MSTSVPSTDVTMSEKSEEVLDRRAIDEAIHDTVGKAFTVLTENFNKKFEEEFSKLKDTLGAPANNEPEKPSGEPSTSVSKDDVSRRSVRETSGEAGDSIPLLMRVPRSNEELDERLLSRVKLGVPEKWNGERGKGRDDVRHFLRGVRRYMQLSGLPERLWGPYATSFLCGKALDLWELEFEDLERTEGMQAVTWPRFEQFMLSTYETLLPVREARERYDKLLQTGSVEDFVRNMRHCVRELEGTVLFPGGSVIVDFIAKLKPDVRRFVQENAPEGWWKSVNQLYQKALLFEMNQRAAVAVRGGADPAVPSVLGKRQAGGEGGKTSNTSKKKQKSAHVDANGDRGVYIPKKEWLARKAAKRCLRCGQEGHEAAKCTNAKTAAPFSEGA